MTIHSKEFHSGYSRESLMEQLNQFVKDEKLSRQDIISAQFVYDDGDYFKLTLLYAKEEE